MISRVPTPRNDVINGAKNFRISLNVFVAVSLKAFIFFKYFLCLMFLLASAVLLRFLPL